MTTYRFKIVGVHYAVNTDHTLPGVENEEMHIRTADRLRELDMQRPKVVLMHEPSNPVDARAVMARAKGVRIGYVDKTQLDTLHALLQANGGRPLRADIREVEARKHGWLFVEIQTDEEVPVVPVQSLSDEWKSWTSTLPSIAPDDAQYGREEAEAMLDEVLSKYITGSGEGMKRPTPDLDLMEEYIDLWLKCALHDLSNEARLTREHYISMLKAMDGQVSRSVAADAEPLPQIRALVYALEKQRTAICGNKRMHIRIEGWWKKLMQSAEMELLWKTWMMHINEDLEQGMQEINAPLKALPFDLYAVVDTKGLFFSRLHYNHVPRAKFWQIVSLMLLRERTLMEREEHPVSEPLQEETHDEPFTVEIPKELGTPKAERILAKLQKKGYLDKDFQPSKLKGWQKGVLAFEVTQHLGIYAKWKVMAALWKVNDKTLRQYYEKSFAEEKTIEFSKKIKSVIG